MDNSKILEIGRKFIKDEREVLEKLEKNLQENFILAAKLISELKGRLIITGIGKNGHIGKKMAHTLLNKLNNYYIELMDAFLNVVGPYIQVVEMADDLGSQNSLLISPELYREMILPYYKKALDFIKSKTNAKIFHHSCGSVVKAADLLLEAGIDVLNSLPVSYTHLTLPTTPYV